MVNTDTGGAVVREAGGQLLAQARALRAAHPDVLALRRLPVGELPEGDELPALRAALGYLRAEMVLVRDAVAGGLWVLDDEVAHVETLLAGSLPPDDSSGG